MPNKCTYCGKIHPDDANYLMTGCDKCGCKFFFYVREEHLQRIQEDLARLTHGDINEIEKDVRDILPESAEKDETVVLDIEAIRIVAPGKYDIDVTNLFNQIPIVIRVGAGKYEIDLSTVMSKWKGKIVGGE
jgi:predicted  nucleic acid-binding Zn-ribbon protein